MSVPVLMYHAVSPLIDGSPKINPVHIPLNDFIEQMSWLKAEGYESISIDELLALKKIKKTAARKVVITFDDGYLSLLEHVTPVLEQYKFRATLFLTTAAVGSESYDLLPHLGKSYPENDRPLSWKELQEMKQRGWNIEAHGHEHKIHNLMSDQELKREMNGCKEQIMEHLQGTCSHYSFPWGRYNSLCLKTLDQLQFRSGFSVQQGLVTFDGDNRRLPRIEINRFIEPETFQQLVQLGYSNNKQKYKNTLINILYKNSSIKDFLKTVSDKFKR